MENCALKMQSQHSSGVSGDISGWGSGSHGVEPLNSGGLEVQWLSCPGPGHGLKYWVHPYLELRTLDGWVSKQELRGGPRNSWHTNIQWMF